MRDHLPWLCQGDIFSSVPVADFTLTDANEVEVSLPIGPAVLLTHDCAMDKPTKTGVPRVERLQFVRLRSIDGLPLQQQQTLRGGRMSVAPFEAMHIGDVSRLGESFILLSDPYYLPAGYFTLKFDDYSNYPDIEPDARYVTPQAHDTRVGRLDEAQLDLLRLKMLAFWARVQPD